MAQIYSHFLHFYISGNKLSSTVFTVYLEWESSLFINHSIKYPNKLLYRFHVNNVLFHLML